ncbi:snoRNA-binding rRNA-processing protein [Xanthoria calcicola]
MARARSISSRSAYRHNPLSEDLVATGPLKKVSKKRQIEPDDEQKYVDDKSSGKILKISRDLVDEAHHELESTPLNSAFTFESRPGNGSGSLRRELEDDDDEVWGEAESAGEEQDLDPRDSDLFNKYLQQPTSQVPISPLAHNRDEQCTSLADLILEKIAMHESARDGKPEIEGGGPPEEAVGLPMKVIEVYSKIGLFLSRYKSGKLPKPFKIIPTLPQWQELLSLTRPEAWTANACYEATRIFVSSNPYVTRQYLETVILDRVREDIHETKKLNVHLYNAVRRSLYRPAAFFKGFLFPLVSSGTCTFREAHIISSVLAKNSIPVLHSAVALLRLTEIATEQSSVATESAGATNIFIRTLLEKKYALPYKVIDGLVFHFLRFRAVPQVASNAEANGDPIHFANDFKLPVLWHQCLLAFAQRYRDDITEDQREALLDLLLSRGHKDIGPEVRRELLAGRGRGVVVEEQGGDGGDDTMMVDPL